MKELNLPPMSNDTEEFFKTVKTSIKEASEKARGQIFTGDGVVLWEEPLEEYEQRMEELNK